MLIHKSHEQTVNFPPSPPPFTYRIYIPRLRKPGETRPSSPFTKLTKESTESAQWVSFSQPRSFNHTAHTYTASHLAYPATNLHTRPSHMRVRTRDRSLTSLVKYIYSPSHYAHLTGTKHYSTFRLRLLLSSLGINLREKKVSQNIFVQISKF
jgi:hypothetical protein